MHRHIQTTNAIESLFSNVRQRTDQIDVFTTETSCLTIVWAAIQDIRLLKIAVELAASGSKKNSAAVHYRAPCFLDGKGERKTF